MIRAFLEAHTFSAEHMNTEAILAAIPSTITVIFDLEMDLKAMAKSLGLPEDATEQQVEAKIKELKALEGNTTEGNSQKKLVAAAVALGKQLGIITDENEEKWQGRFESDPEDATERLEELIAAKGSKAPEAEEKPSNTDKSSKRLSEFVASYMKDNGKPKPEASEKKYTDMSEEEIDALADSDPAKLEALLKAEFPDSDNPNQY
jgi:hypothetical protein